MKSVEFLCCFNPQVTIGVNGYHTLRDEQKAPSVDAYASYWKMYCRCKSISIVLYHSVFSTLLHDFGMHYSFEIIKRISVCKIYVINDVIEGNLLLVILKEQNGVNVQFVV